MSIIKDVFAGLLTPVTDMLKQRGERKLVEATAKAKLAAAKQQGKKEVTLTDAEWESIAVNKTDSTWKDEYVTIVITAPLVLILVGSIALAFTGDARLLEGTVGGVTALAALDVDLGELMYAVVLAAIGLKLWRGR